MYEAIRKRRSLVVWYYSVMSVFRVPPLVSGVFCVLLILLLQAGCFQEKSFPLRSDELVYIGPPKKNAQGNGNGETTRQWLVRTQNELEVLLTERGKHVITTEQMVDENGWPRNVYAYLDEPIEHLNLLTKNYWGILHTAQGASQSLAIEEPPPPWPGFEQVWIPVADNLKLSGRLGLARRDGNVQSADCIVLLPGLWGDNGIKRTRDLAIAFRSQGFHVLALELRGHGQTERFYPNVYYNFGAIESQDLLRVSEWLEDRHPYIERTGLIGFCWGGNVALLAAWLDGREPNDPSISDKIAVHLDPPSPRRHYEAGMLIFSAILDWEDILDRADTEHSIWVEPVMYFFQRVVENRMVIKNHPERNGNLRHLIDFEFAKSFFGPSFPIEEAYRFLRLLPYKGRSSGDKLESIQIPTLILHTINDPFASAQALANLMSMTENPNVAGLILRGGGHVGYFPYNQVYTYSLIMNFFDPKRGPAAIGGERG